MAAAGRARGQATVRALRRFFARLVAFLFRARAERELGREIDAHLTLLQDEFERRGLTPDAARRAAKRAYGGIEQAKELHRDERSFLWLEQALLDGRHACWTLKRSPGFTLVAVVTLALGMGLNTTLFSAYNAVALKPLPVSNPKEVVGFTRWVKGHRQGASQSWFSYSEYLYCREQGDRLSSLVAGSSLVGALGTLSTGAGIGKLSGQLVSSNYFAVLGIQPVLGRGFQTEDKSVVSASPFVVISYRFWQRGFGGDPHVVGSVIDLNSTAFSIIGIAPEDFTGTSEVPVVPDFWAPVSMQPALVPGQEWLGHPDQRHLQILARVKPGDLPKAQAQADFLVRQLAATSAAPDTTEAVTLQRTSYLPSADRIGFQTLATGVMLIFGLVLFVACANVGNMLLAHGAARQREISTRLALGASRGRVIRQLLVESILLSCLGGCVALPLSIWTTSALQKIAGGADLNLALNLAPDARVVAYVLVMSLVTGILFGLSPALQFTRRDLTTALKDEGVSFGHLSGSRLRSLLVKGQVGVSVLLLAIASLLTRGLVRSQTVDLGFDPRDILVITGDFAPDREGNDPVKAIDREKRLAERLRARPEFASVSLGGHPFNGGTWNPSIVVGASTARAAAGFASETYFKTLGIALLRGRNFTAQEAAAGAAVAVVSEATARRFWPNQDPLGQRFTLDMDSRNLRGKLASFDVIGVARDVRFDNPTRVDRTHVYLPAGVSDNARVAGAHGAGIVEILVRVQGDHQRALAAIEATVEAFDIRMRPGMRVINLEEGELRSFRAASQVLMMLASILGGLAVTLAGVGIYGVMAYLVSQRTREIGVRMALGANAKSLLTGVVLQGLRPVFVGLLLGTAAAATLSSLLHLTVVFTGSIDLLYGVPFYDPVTFAGMSLFVLVVAALASALPARRALTVEPMVALRCE
jgi:predicted permease